MIDQYGRNINYMRISVTDRCNLRCRYCMPDGIELVHMKEILTFEEIVEITEAAVQLGISRIKITGGEPLVRPGCADLVRMIKEIPGIEQVTMTTNGVLLRKYLEDLISAGLDAVNISLDTLNRERYALITGRDTFTEVMAGIREAAASPLRVKINTVLQQGVNDVEWLSLAELARDHPLDVRFIEMMPIGYGADVPGVSNTVLYEELKENYPQVIEDLSEHGNGPAVYVHIPGWQGSVGFISAIHGKFCSTCNRIRLSSQGMIKPCLCYGDTADLRSILRGEEDPGFRVIRLCDTLSEAIYNKPSQHSFEEEDKITEKDSMSRIGG